MTDDEQEFFNKSIGKLEKEIIALKKEYQAECNRADELEDSLQTSWQNESKLKEQLEIAIKALKEYADTHRWSDCYLHQENNGLDDFFTRELYDQYGYSTAEEALKDIKQIGEKKCHKTGRRMKND